MAQVIAETAKTFEDRLKSEKAALEAKLSDQVQALKSEHARELAATRQQACAEVGDLQARLELCSRQLDTASRELTTARERELQPLRASLSQVTGELSETKALLARHTADSDLRLASVNAQLQTAR